MVPLVLSATPGREAPLSRRSLSPSLWWRLDEWVAVSPETPTPSTAERRTVPLGVMTRDAPLEEESPAVAARQGARDALRRIERVAREEGVENPW